MLWAWSVVRIIELHKIIPKDKDNKLNYHTSIVNLNYIRVKLDYPHFMILSTPVLILITIQKQIQQLIIAC